MNDQNLPKNTEQNIQPTEVMIRPACDSDVALITHIFNQSIRHSTATFYTEPRSESQIRAWLDECTERHVCLVAEVDNQLVGFAKLSAWSDRAAYDHTAETTFYVDEAFQGRGIGRKLKASIVAAANEQGFHTLIARVAEGSEASMAVHQKLGFQNVGTLKQVGRKFGRWLDVHVLQLMLDDDAFPRGAVAWINGQFVDADPVTVPISDLGFALGVSVSERLRTFSGKPHLLNEHLDRFARGIAMAGIQLQRPIDEIRQAVLRLAELNVDRQSGGVDLDIGLVATGGRAGSVIISSRTLPIERWRERYRKGVALTTVGIREIPGECLPKGIKHRNRLHYWLADQQAEAKLAGSFPLLLDVDGFVAESSSAAVFAYHRDRGLTAPSATDVLPSITLRFLFELAALAGVPTTREKLTVDQLHSADEVFMCNSLISLVPVVQCDGKQLGNGQPGAIFGSLREAWKRTVGVDFAE